MLVINLKIFHLGIDHKSFSLTKCSYLGMQLRKQKPHVLGIYYHLLFPASFIIQFLMLSLLIGIPLFTLYLCLGQVLESGPVDMWRISPIFQGVGVSILITQAVIGMYSIIGLSWIFVYFRDSFISTDDRYKWALPHEYNFEGEFQITLKCLSFALMFELKTNQ